MGGIRLNGVGRGRGRGQRVRAYLALGFMLLATAAALALSAGASVARAGTPTTTTSSDQAVAYQGDPAHDGDDTTSSLTLPASELWTHNFNATVSYPLIAGNVVYVTTGTLGNSGSYGENTLWALNATTGATLWSKSLGGTYTFTAIAYDAGQIFAVDFDGLLTAFNATTGATNWSEQLSGQYEFTSPPTATDGMVLISGAGSGGTVYAVNESDGSLVWTAGVENGDHSSPAVSGSSVYVDYACNQAYDFDLSTGALNWHDSSDCEGGGGKTAVVADGDVFLRDGDTGDRIVSAATGATLGPLAAAPAPAVGDGMAYELDGGTLSAVSGSGSGTTAWSFTGDGQLDSAPLIVGNYVFVGSDSGELYGLDAATGSVIASADLGSPIAAPDEQNADPLTGFAAGDGVLAVPATDTLTVFGTAPAAASPPKGPCHPLLGAIQAILGPAGSLLSGLGSLPCLPGLQF